MLLILGFAKSYDAEEPIFAYGDREVPGEDRGWREFRNDRGERE
jgi:hypothetical protein